MNITGHTRLLALFGSPVKHSGSPAMYNYSFEKRCLLLPSGRKKHLYFLRQIIYDLSQIIHEAACELSGSIF